MRFRGVVFDLDGTLLDSVADIAAAANRALVDLGQPSHPESAYLQFVGEGVEVLFRRCLPPVVAKDDAQVARAVAGFFRFYAEEWDRRTHPYNGIAEMLDGLTQRGLAMAVLSNKPDEFTRRCVERFLAGRPFGAVYGQREGVPRKPDPAGAVAIARELGLRPDTLLYLGDTAVDMETARGAGMHPIGVSWGFRPVEELVSTGAEAIVHHPSEVLGIVDGTTSLANPPTAGRGIYDTDPGL